MKKYSFLLPLIALFLFSSHPVFAAKPRIKKTTGTTATNSVMYSSVKLSRSTNSIVLSLLNLNTVKKVTYELNYSANGVPQGAMGTVVVTGQQTDGRDLYLGTCSHGVCTPHRNITGTTLTVNTVRTSGSTFVKRYRIKI